MDTVQWGIIGCGDVTEVKSGPAFSKVKNSSLVAVMRRDGHKAKDYAERHHVSTWYSHAQELINDPDVNAVYVATPPLYHEEYTIAALEAGKPVYVEKPMAVHAAAAKRMAQTAINTGTKLSIAHYRRQQPLFKKIKEVIEGKGLGEIRCVNLQFFQPAHSNLIAHTEANWRIDPAISGGGLFHDLAPHQLDLMHYFFGVSKQASGVALNSARLYEADDIVAGNIVFEKGIVFNGLWCFCVPQNEAKDKCEIIGSEGKLSFSVFEHKPFIITVNGNKEVTTVDKLEHVQQPMIEEVVRYFRGESDNPCPAEDGVAVMEWIDQFTGKQHP